MGYVAEDGLQVWILLSLPPSVKITALHHRQVSKGFLWKMDWYFKNEIESKHQWTKCSVLLDYILKRENGPEKAIAMQQKFLNALEKSSSPLAFQPPTSSAWRKWLTQGKWAVFQVAVSRLCRHLLLLERYFDEEGPLGKTRNKPALAPGVLSPRRNSSLRPGLRHHHIR